MSLSARRAWIEITAPVMNGAGTAVALRKESVDRNQDRQDTSDLLAGSLSARRAWIEIRSGRPAPTSPAASLSARRAWIEMVTLIKCTPAASVALRKESVDRNAVRRGAGGELVQSLSARRAWIEITGSWPSSCAESSLSARRAWIEIVPACRLLCKRSRRSPQGERG